jgi:micrococcal nuclease
MKVRLIGIDAPETRRTRLKEVGYYAEESRAYLSKLIFDKRVRLEFDVDTFDQYRRTLAYVYLENGTFINANMLKEGYAMALTVPPNVKYSEEFAKLARKARERNRGLWNQENKISR